MSSRPQPPTRRELAAFIPDPRTLRAFEQLFEAVPGDISALQALIDAVTATAQDAGETATAARSVANRAAAELRDLTAAAFTARDYGATIADLQRRVADLESLLQAQR